MPLAFNDVQDAVRHALGGDPAPGLSMLDIINGAGEMLVNSQTWRWLEDTEAKLDLRGKITITGASSSTTAFTSTGSFANYAFVEGDQLEITSASGITTGFYRIASRTSDNAIVLSSSPGTTGSSIAATLHTSALALPADFRDLIAYNTTSGLLKGIQFTSHGDLLQKRAASFSTVGFHYAAIVHPINSAGGAPVPRLEIWPTPSSNETAAITILYRRGWVSLENDSTLISIPTWMHPVFFEFLRAFAHGWEESDVATASERVMGVMQGPIWAAAVQRDASIEADLGPVLHGAAGSSGYGSPFQNFNSVSAPS